MNPAFIGTAERRLFSIYEPAAPTRAPPRAALLCHPWGEEYIYAHRSVRHLAARLAALGFHTLRFDYFGTGDSGGEAAQTDLAGMAADTATAIEALRGMAGTSAVTLIGLRAGANVAASVASRRPRDVAALLLWDPLVAGAQEAGEDPLAARLLRDIVAVDLRAALTTMSDRALVLVTAGGRDGLAGEAAAMGEFIRAPCPWVESATTSGALPVQVFRRIETWLQ